MTLRVFRDWSLGAIAFTTTALLIAASHGLNGTLPIA